MAKAQDAAYASLLSRDRQTLQRKVAGTVTTIKDSVRIGGAGDIVREGRAARDGRGRS
jgi:hypothetical protein